MSSSSSSSSDNNDEAVTTRLTSATSPSVASVTSVVVPGPGPGGDVGADINQQTRSTSEDKNETSPGGSAFALYRDRAGSGTNDSQHHNHQTQAAEAPTDSNFSNTTATASTRSTFSSIAAGTAFTLSPSLIAGGSTAAGFLTTTSSASSSIDNGVCAPSQLTSTLSPLFGTQTSVSPSSTTPVAAAIANAINATSNSLITNSSFVFGKGLFDRVANGDNKDQGDVSSNGTSSLTSTTVSASGDGVRFVFGQNLSDRVTNQQAASEEKVNEGDDNNGQNEAATPTLFQSATDQLPGITLEPEVFGAAGNAALAQLNNADIIVSTGEEDERNVLQMNCKLYIFDKETSNWVERGQGQLRLNDPARGSTGKSRVIIRTAGTLRVLLNTQIWEGIDLKISGDKKGLLLIGRDELNDHKLHVFMIKCPSEVDVSNLNRSISSRLELLRKAAKEEEKAAASSEDSHKTSAKRIIPKSKDNTTDSPTCASLPPSTKKAHLE